MLCIICTNLQDMARSKNAKISGFHVSGRTCTGYFSYQEDQKSSVFLIPSRGSEIFSVAPTIKRIGDFQCFSYYQEDRIFQCFSYDQEDLRSSVFLLLSRESEIFSVSHTIKRISDLQWVSYYQEDQTGSVFLLLSRGSEIFSVSPTIKRIGDLQCCSYYKEVLLQDWLCSEKICTMH